MSAQPRAFTVRHLQLLRAVFAAIAALMITFSADHSAEVGLSAFSGLAVVTALVLAVGAGVALPRGRRWSTVLLAVVHALAGIAASVPVWRTEDGFFIIVISWAALSAIIEIVGGIRARRLEDPHARDSILIGGLTALLAVALLLIPAGFATEYTVDEAGTFQLTGIILGVGMLGGYAALVAVFLGIAGLTPQRTTATAPSDETEPVTGGAA